MVQGVAYVLVLAVVKTAIAQVIWSQNSPWEVAFTPDGDVLYTENCHGLSVLTVDGQLVTLLDNSSYGLMPDFFCDGLSGMNGMVVDPDFGIEGSPYSRDIYTYFLSSLDTDRPSIRVARISLAPNIVDPPVRRVDIMSGIMYKNKQFGVREENGSGVTGSMSSGRLRFGLRGTQYEGILFITSGDNHNSTLPQDLWGLGGKVFAIDRNGNPFSGNLISEGDPRVFAYGFRNAQGLAMRPGTEQIFMTEHGPSYSDEVTMLTNGGNGGWDPKDRPGLACEEDGNPGDGYCGYVGEFSTMPMTDFERFPDAMPPVWDYNQRSAGMSSCIFLEGAQWGEFEGWLAVGIMGGDLSFPGDQTIVLLELSDEGEFISAQYIPSIPKGRYRSLIMAPSGNLMVVEQHRFNNLLPGNRPNIRELTPEDFGVGHRPVVQGADEDEAMEPVFIAGITTVAVVALLTVVGWVVHRSYNKKSKGSQLVQDNSFVYEGRSVQSLEVQCDSKLGKTAQEGGSYTILAGLS